jgi:uncharacterized protein DUF5060
MSHTKQIKLVAAMLTSVLGLCHLASAGQVSGELKAWHKVTITFEGPQTSEQATPNPFLDYRLNVKFTKGNKSYLVPGYFAADGNAANTSAEAGNKWRVHFAPDAAGTWRYQVSFRKGKNVAVSEDSLDGASGGFMDEETGTLEIGPTDKSGRDFRGKGRLDYVGKHHLRFAGTGEYFLKCGADAPENFLAYKDFDGDFKTDGHKDNFIKDWAPHIQDWKPGDPTWQNGKGKGMIGAINYLASQGMNVFSFLPMNIQGDDQNVFPYTTYDERLRMDVSRLEQWAIVFEHGTKLGMYLHFKTMETENELILDKGDLGIERKLYYRELISRFSHNLALNWNLGEEINNASHEQKVAWANYFWTHDPYQHHIVIHNMGDPHYDLLGNKSKLTGFSLQTSKTDFSQVHRRSLDYVQRSVTAGKPWVVACDEPGDASHGLITDAEDPTRDNARKNALWGNIMAGGAGVEWYFGYKHPHSDLTCQDYRTRQKMWDQCRYALQFFEKYKIPFWHMKCEDDLTKNRNDYCLIKPGELYLIYIKSGGELKLNIKSGGMDYGWYNPRTGKGLQRLIHSGSAKGPKEITLATPDKSDWLLTIKKSGSGKLDFEDLSEVSAADVGTAQVVTTIPGGYVLNAIRDFKTVSGGDLVPYYTDSGHGVLAINAAQYKDKFAAAETKFSGKTGTYDVTIVTMTETDGEATYKLSVGGKQVGTFVNPSVQEDYQKVLHTWKNVALKKGDSIQVASNTASNKRFPEENSFGYARGRWLQLMIAPPETKIAAKVVSPQPPKSVAVVKPTAPKAVTADPTIVKIGPGKDMIFEEKNGLVAVEAEHFAKQVHSNVRKWYITTPDKTPNVTPDGDENHAASASGKGYLEVLPDTRRNHGHKLINGENFSNTPGKLAIVSYPVFITNPGRYYVWVRAYSTGSEDNGLHVGLDGKWPTTGQRLQWCAGKKSWWWESKQRTEKEHCGEPYKIFLDINEPGLHTISFSLREDGFEFDTWLMTKEREFTRPKDAGPAERLMKADG